MGMPFGRVCSPEETFYPCPPLEAVYQAVEKKEGAFLLGGHLPQDIQEHILKYLDRVFFTILSPGISVPASGRANDLQMLASSIINVILSKDFNYQSKNRIAHLVGSAQEGIIRQIKKGSPLEFYLDYGGGYHAAADPSFNFGLTFHPSIAEILLVYQIVKFERKICGIYAPGVVFYIVLDDITANYVNEIPVILTEGYIKGFRALLSDMGLSDRIKILAQSETSVFSQKISRMPRPLPVSSLTQAEHENVQRFLGRVCSTEEAQERAGRYLLAESVWEPELRQITSIGIRFLQRASEDYFSFRSFPGGATRAQCGQMGFSFRGGKVVPTLVTTTTHETKVIVPFVLDWCCIFNSYLHLPQQGGILA